MNMFALKKSVAIFLAPKRIYATTECSVFKFLLMLFCSVCSYPVVELLSRCSSEKAEEISNK